MNLKKIKKELPHDLILPLPEIVLENALNAYTVLKDKYHYRHNALDAVIVAALIELVERRATDGEKR